MKLFVTILVFGLFFLGFKSLVFGQSKTNQLISPDKAHQMIANDSIGIILDVRTSIEYKKGHIANAHQINFLGFSFNKGLSKFDKNQTVLVYCQTGHRSKYAIKKIKQYGFTDIVELKGGLKSWVNKELPTVKTD